MAGLWLLGPKYQDTPSPPTKEIAGTNMSPLSLPPHSVAHSGFSPSCDVGGNRISRAPNGRVSGLLCFYLTDKVFTTGRLFSSGR